MKLLKVIGLIILILLILAGGWGTYYFYNQRNRQRQAQQDFQRQIKQLKKQLADLQKAASAAENEETEEADWRTCAEFSAEDRDTISDWHTYTNDTYHYRFKYPSDWTLSADDPVSITVAGRDSGEEISFQARAARMTEMDFGEFNKVFTRNIRVNCENATENTYDGPDNLTLVTENFTKSETPYLLIFSFKDIGTSYTADIVAINNLILKTFDFRS